MCSPNDKVWESSKQADSRRLLLKNDVWWNKEHVIISEDWGRMDLGKRKKMTRHF